MKNIESLTKTELSLLLFLETKAVDHRGRVDVRHMNEEDFVITERWNDEGFVEFGRIYSKDLSEFGTYWCKLSEDAFRLAHAERVARAERGWANRNYRRTVDK